MTEEEFEARRLDRIDTLHRAVFNAVRDSSKNLTQAEIVGVLTVISASVMRLVSAQAEARAEELK